MKKVFSLILAVALVSCVTSSNLLAVSVKTKVTTDSTLTSKGTTTAVNKSVDKSAYSTSSVRKNTDGTVTYTTTKYTSDGAIDGQTITTKDKKGNVVSKEIVAYENGIKVGRADITSGGPVQTFDQLREAVDILKHTDFSNSNTISKYFSSTNADLAKCTNVTSVYLYKSDFAGLTSEVDLDYDNIKRLDKSDFAGLTGNPCGLDLSDSNISKYGDKDVVATVNFSVTGIASVSTKNNETQYYKQFNVTVTQKSNDPTKSDTIRKVGSKLVEVNEIGSSVKETTLKDKIKNSWNNAVTNVKTSWNKVKLLAKSIFSSSKIKNQPQ